MVKGTAPATQSDHTIVVIDARGISGNVQVGGYLTTASGRRYYQILRMGKLRRAGDAGTKPTLYRLTLSTVPKATVPANTTPAVKRNGWRPSRAKHEPAPSTTRISKADPSPAAIKARREKEATTQLRRAKTLLRDDRDTDRRVAVIRTTSIHDGKTLLRTANVEADEWVDPDDMQPNRRTARRIQGFRAVDVLMTHQKRNSLITKKHVKAANMLRAHHDIGLIGARPGYMRPVVGSVQFGPSGGPQENQLICLQEYEAARAAVGPRLFGILLHVVIQNKDLASYRRLGRAAMGYLVAALDALAEHYQPPKDASRE